MNYNHKNNTIHYHCNLCNKDYICNRKSFMTRMGRKQNPCPQCYTKNSGYSTFELEIRKYIKQIYKGSCYYNYRKIIHKEIDIYLPELKIGIEFDGKYWHMDNRIYKSTDYNKNKQLTAKQIWEYDTLKDRLAENKGIKLLHIKELDWINSKDSEKIKISKFIENSK